MKRFDGRAAFITGAAHGQGRAAAVAFAREGASVAAFDLARPPGRDLTPSRVAARRPRTSRRHRPTVAASEVISTTASFTGRLAPVWTTNRAITRITGWWPS